MATNNNQQYWRSILIPPPKKNATNIWLVAHSYTSASVSSHCIFAMIPTDALVKAGEGASQWRRTRILAGDERLSQYHQYRPTFFFNGILSSNNQQPWLIAKIINLLSMSLVVINDGQWSWLMIVKRPIRMAATTVHAVAPILTHRCNAILRLVLLPLGWVPNHPWMANHGI